MKVASVRERLLPWWHAFMNVALDRVCEHTPLGEQHDVRERLAQGIIRCAKRTTLGALIEAGERALARIPEKPKNQREDAVPVLD